MVFTSRSLLERAIAFEREGKWNEALTACGQAYDRSWSESDAIGLIEAAYRAALAYRGLGDLEVSGELLGLVLALSELHQNMRFATLALNLLGVIRYEHGHLDSAKDAYLEARELAASSDNFSELGHIEQNLGILAFVRGDHEEALVFYKSGLAHYEQLSDAIGVARVLNNLAMLHTELRDFDRAEEALSRALSIARETGDSQVEGIIHTNLAELWLLKGDPDQARISCDLAFEVASSLDNKPLRADVLKLYGQVYQQTQKPYLAEVHLREAVEIAQLHDYPLQEADAQRELALVLRRQDKNREALAALNRAHHLFSLLRVDQKQAEIDKRLDQLEEDFLLLVHAWGESIESKDRYTAGHCQRVADYACRVAERAGISARDLTWFRMGAFLHDVGKTETPEGILNKPGRLTTEELSVMQHHTIAGDELLSSINFPYDVRAMVRSHHERWSGGGYPDGLVGEEIPFTARILRIADVFDALTTTRSYREPMSAERALQIMEDEADTYDPELFAIFRELFPTFAEEVRTLHAERWTSSLAEKPEHSAKRADEYSEDVA